MSQGGNDSKTRLNEGLELTRTGQYTNAIERFNEAIKITSADHDLAAIFYNKGIALFLLGEYFEALGCFEKASKLSAKLSPIIPYIWYNKGITLGKLERYGEAIECFNKAMEFQKVGKRDPDIDTIEEEPSFNQADGLNIQFWLSYNKGIALSNLEKYEEAEKCFQKAVDISEDRKKGNNHYSKIEDSERALAWYNKGYALGKQKNYKHALESFERATKIDKYNADAWRNRFFVLYKEKGIEEADAIFKEAKNIVGDFVYMLNTKGYALNCLGAKEKDDKKAGKHFHDAIGYLKQATEIDSKFAPAWYNMGYARYSLGEVEKDSLGEVEKAIECFDKAISSNPKNAYAWNYRGLVLFDLKKYRNAIRCFNNAIEVDDDNRYAWYGKAITHLKIKDYYEALGCFDRLTRICKKCKKDDSALDYEVLAWNYKGLCFTNMTNDKYNKYKKRYKKRSTDTDKELLREERLSEALACFEEAKKIDGKIAEVWRNEGYAYGNLKKYEEAIKSFKEAIEILEAKNESEEERQHGLSNTYRNMGFANYKLGESEKGNEADNYFKEGRKCFQKAVDILSEDRKKGNNHYSKIEESELALAYNSLGYNIIRTLKDPKEAEDAVEDFNVAIGIKPDFAYAWYNKGIAHSILGSQAENKKEREICFEDAKYAFDKAIDLKPHSSYAWNGKGYALNFLGRYAEAIECFNKAMEFQKVGKRDPDIDTIEEEPSFNYAWNGKGYALNFLGRYAEAIEYFDNVIREVDETIKKDPLCADGYNNKGIAHYNKGIALFNLEIYHEAKKEFGEAIGCFKDAAGIEPIKKGQEQQARNEAKAHLSMGQCKYALEKYDEAKDEFEKMNDEYLDSALKSEKHNNIGLCLYQLEEFKEAKEEFEKAKKFDESSITAHYNLAVFYYNKEKNLDKAKMKLQTCNDLAEDNTANYKEVARVNKALKTMTDSSGPSNWYDWWFATQDKSKRILGWIVIGSILASFLALVIVSAIKYFSGGSIDGLGLGGLVILIVLFTGMLLLPSLRKFAVSGVEFSTEKFSTEILSAKSVIEPEMTKVDVVKSNMPFSDPIQSFSMPLQHQELSLIKDFQLNSVVMPLEYTPNHAMLYKISVRLVDGQDLL